MIGISYLPKSSFFRQPFLCAGILLGLGLVSTETPFWIVLITATVLALKFAFDIFGVKPWSPKISVFLGLLLAAEVYFRVGTLMDQDATASLVLGLTALRVMDYRSPKDNRFLQLLGFVIYSLKPLFALDIYWLLPSLFGYFLIWLSMFEGEQKNAFKYVIKVFALSLPMAILLFFLFPRLILPWAKDQVTSSGRIGFSDNLNPGAFSDLALQSETAFRFKVISGEQPKVRNLYWRGGVLEISNGLEWKPRYELNREAGTGLAQEKPVTTQVEVTLEDFRNTYLFALDYPTKVNTPLPTQNYQGNYFRLTRPPNQRIIYRSNAIDAPPDEFLDEAKFKIYTGHPVLEDRSQNLIDEIKSSSHSARARVEELKAFFIRSNLVFTLRPGTYASMDEFLFDRKRGFCEHFAASFATLGRALGVPTRLVIGFHGGAYNRYGDFWEVSSRDAHAWTEVHLDGRWERIDPTEWSDPRRVELGGAQYFQLNDLLAETLGSEVLRQSYRLARDYGLIPIIETLLFRIEHLNFLWVQFLLNFSLESQYSGLFSSGVFLGLFAFAALLISILLFAQRKSHGPSKLKIQLSVQSVVEIFENADLKRLPGEPPLTFLRRIANALENEEKILLYDLADTYEKSVYNEAPSLGDQDFKNSLRLLKAAAKRVKTTDAASL